MIEISGVLAAVLSPRNAYGSLNLASFRAQITALRDAGVAGYAINGATGEFTISSAVEVHEQVTAARELDQTATILCGAGAADVHGTLLRAEAAANAGADALLLPMPCFFPYRQDDLIAYVTEVASAVKLPVLLYNLPQFTTGLEVETALTLLHSHDNIIGIKDSSGSLDIVRAITEAKLPVSRIIGNDGALCDALTGGLCDAVVSGVACTLPELMINLFDEDATSATFVEYRALLDEFIAQLGPLATPWGLKVTSAVRGWTAESYPFPLSEQRQAETAALRTWFKSWSSKATKPEASAA